LTTQGHVNEGDQIRMGGKLGFDVEKGLLLRLEPELGFIAGEELNGAGLRKARITGFPDLAKTPHTQEARQPPVWQAVRGYGLPLPALRQGTAEELVQEPFAAEKAAAGRTMSGVEARAVGQIDEQSCQLLCLHIGQLCFAGE